MSVLGKGLSILGLALGVCSIAQSSELDASVIPSQEPGFGASIAGLLLQPNTTSLVYAVYTTPLPVPSPNWYQKQITPQYRGAFDLEVKYNFSEKDNNHDQAKLNWLHFNSSYSKGFVSPNNSDSVGPVFYYGPLEQFLVNTSAIGKVKFGVDQVNLIYGHSIELTRKIQIKPYFGVSFVNLKEDMTNLYNGSDPVAGPYSHTMYVNSKFTGFSPRLRLDANYFFKSNFGINAKMAGNIFIGQTSNSTYFDSITGFTSGKIPSNVTPTRTQMANQYNTTVVPEVDSEIGLFYTTKLVNDTKLTIQVGYMFVDYINSINQVLPNTLVPGAWELGSVAIVNQSQQRSDLSLNGPYVRLVWK